MVLRKLFPLRTLILILTASICAIYLHVTRISDELFEPHKSVLANTKIPLDVYYESLCPDSRSFFIVHLLPSVNKFSAFVTVNLIPYGKAQTIFSGDKIEFNCQHGPAECERNKIHACVIRKSSGDDVLAVNVTSCLFKDYQIPSWETCCRKFGLNWEEVKLCAKGSEGTLLLKKYGDLTNSLLPPLYFIPTIAINKTRGSIRYQAAILKNLSGVLSNVLKL